MVAGILLYLARRFEDRMLPGDLLLSYLILYPLGRFMTEFQRPDAWTIAGIPTAQIIATISIVGASALLIYRHRAAISRRRMATQQRRQAG